MGRKKLPENVKKLKGTARSDRAITNHLDPPDFDTLPEPPDHLNEGAKKVWDTYGPGLVTLGVLRSTDIELFAAYCIEIATYRKCTEIMNDEGEWIEEQYSDGTIKSMKRHPAALVRSKALQHVIKISSLFGLDPHSRQSLPVETDEPDELEKFMRTKIG